ncbi:MAG: nucleotidyltransferase domain-containing protein [Acidobacteriota bacterium]
MRKNGLEHLAENERAALNDFVVRLRQAYASQVVRVVLFGSKARGDSDAESDLDVLVVINSDDWRLHDQVVTLSSPVSVKHDALISPKVIGPSLYRRMRRLRSLFLENILREGRILWTKRPARRSAKTSPAAATN